MKKGIGFLLYISILMMLFSCGGNSSKQQNNLTKKGIEADSAAPANKYDSASVSTQANQSDEDSIPSIKIGTQVWMAEDLDVTTFRNGDDIPDINNYGTNSTHLPKKPAFFCTCDGDTPDNEFIYNWYAVNDKRGLAPKGWHIPTCQEYTILINYLRTNPLKKIKDTIGWHFHNSFNRYYSRNKDTILHSLLVDCLNAYEIQNFCSFWTSTPVKTNGNYAWFFQVAHREDSTLHISSAEKWFGLPVRCIKDN